MRRGPNPRQVGLQVNLGVRLAMLNRAYWCLALSCALAAAMPSLAQAGETLPSTLPRFQDWLQLWQLPVDTEFTVHSRLSLRSTYRDTLPPDEFPIVSVLVWSPDSTLGVDFMGCMVEMDDDASLHLRLDDAWNVYLFDPTTGERTLLINGGISLWAQDAEWESPDTFWIYGRLIDGHGQCNPSIWRVDLDDSLVTEFRGPLMDPEGEQIWTDWQALLGDRFPFLR